MPKKTKGDSRLSHRHLGRGASEEFELTEDATQVATQDGALDDHYGIPSGKLT